MKKTEDSPRDLWNNIKCTNIWIIGVPEEEYKKMVWENFWSDCSWKFSHPGKCQSSQRGIKSPIQDKLKEKHTKTQINQTKTKHKERIIKAAREKQQVTYKGNPICILIAELSAETLQARRGWQEILKILKGKNLQPQLLYPTKISFKIDGETKSF